MRWLWCSPREPNYDTCERCRLVYFVMQVRDMREAQTKYFRSHGADSNALDLARHLESKVDTLIKRFTTRPESTLFSEEDDDQSNESYFTRGG